MIELGTAKGGSNVGRFGSLTHHLGKKAAMIIALEAPSSLLLKSAAVMDLSNVAGQTGRTEEEYEQPKMILDSDLCKKQYPFHSSKRSLSFKYKSSRMLCFKFSLT